MNQEVISVMRADTLRQYKYFLHKIVDREEVWSLRDKEGWVTSGDTKEEFFPVWPQKEFAEIFIANEWKNCYPERIDLYDFLENWINGLMNDGIRISVMWNNGKGIDIDWSDLKSDIELEMQKYV